MSKTLTRESIQLAHAGQVTALAGLLALTENLKGCDLPAETQALLEQAPEHIDRLADDLRELQLLKAKKLNASSHRPNPGKALEQIGNLLTIYTAINEGLHSEPEEYRIPGDDRQMLDTMPESLGCLAQTLGHYAQEAN